MLDGTTRRGYDWLVRPYGGPQTRPKAGHEMGAVPCQGHSLTVCLPRFSVGIAIE